METYGENDIWRIYELPEICLLHISGQWCRPDLRGTLPRQNQSITGPRALCNVKCTMSIRTFSIHFKILLKYTYYLNHLSTYYQRLLHQDIEPSERTHFYYVDLALFASYMSSGDSKDGNKSLSKLL